MNGIRGFIVFTAVVVALAALAGSAPARVKLVTLPERERIRLSLEHPEANLVEEERTLSLQKGVNKVDFNWQGVSIDADAIILEPLEHPDEVKLIAVRVPPGENALVWDIFSPRAMTERVRVTYFLDGIGREFTSRAIADRDEKSMELKTYLRLRNDSGEKLENAEIVTGITPAFRTNLEAGEIRQRLIEEKKIPFSRSFTWDAAVMPDDPEKAGKTVGIPVRYVIVNDRANGQGEHSLQAGKYRIFQDDGKGATAFLGEDWGALTPISKDLKLFVSESRDVKVTKKRKDVRHTKERRNSKNQVVLFDETADYELVVENFRDKPVTASILNYFDETWDITASSLKYERDDYRTLRFEAPLAASDSTIVTFTVERRNLMPGSVLR